MKRVINALANRSPLLEDLRAQVRMQGFVPAGHYYSPIPSKEDVDAFIKSRRPPTTGLPGIDLNEQGQLQLLNEYVRFYHDQPFTERQNTEHRYYFENDWFSYSDAIFLYGFLRKHLPRRIIEVGSGFSSAVILDTIDGYFPQRPEVTFIEPYPERLIGLLREGDNAQVRLVERKVQDVSLSVFSSLGSGDLLFIDSSHVMKCGSDLQFLMFEVLPRLQPGVFVHFHDVFYPFDYPYEWLHEGRYWNENYILHAFLSWNSEWSIQFFNTYAHFRFADLIKEKMPLCLKNHGGSLYIRRRQKR